jgi:hypothetical protein
VFHFGWHILAMSQSSQSILDHIADFLKFISNTQSFWFMLDMSYNHGCHLAIPFRLEPNDYEVLLVVAGLAHYTRFVFAMKLTAWSKE